MIEERLKELGFTLPPVAKPLAAYIPAKKSGNLIYTSGQLPFENGVLRSPGKVGTDVSLEDAKKAAEISVLNCLAAVNDIAGSLENVKEIIKITVFVNSDINFSDQPLVANGASELIQKIFGDKGVHSRSAVGVAQLPKNACVEIEMIAEV